MFISAELKSASEPLRLEQSNHVPQQAHIPEHRSHVRAESVRAPLSGHPLGFLRLLCGSAFSLDQPDAFGAGGSRGQPMVGGYGVWAVLWVFGLYVNRQNGGGVEWLIPTTKRDEESMASKYFDVCSCS